MAEEFTLHQFGRNRPAVDRDERVSGPGAKLVEQTGDPFLATAGFTADIDRRQAVGQLVDVATQGIHGRRVSQQLPGWVLRCAVRGLLQAGTYPSAQLLEVQRLVQQLAGSGLQGARAGLCTGAVA